MISAIKFLTHKLSSLHLIKEDLNSYETFRQLEFEALEKEKEQLQKAFSDGQETPINHPTLPHYSREEYYNDNYNQNK